jgi:uncharacterized protein
MKSDRDDLTRRDFLSTSATLGAGAVLTGALGPLGVAEGARKIPTVKLGKTGEKVTILGFGGAVTVTPQLLNASLAEGVTYLDTAQSYGKGNSEKNVGKILAANGRRKDCFIVTKCGNHKTGPFTESLETSFERLQTDYVDLYYLHNLGDPERLDNELKATAEKLKKEKKIRYFGFSSHHAGMVPTLNRAAEVGFVDVIMLKYNFKSYEDKELNKALDRCAKAGIGLVAMKTQQGAEESFQDRVNPFKEKGFNQYQATLRAVWKDDRIHSIVSAMKNVKQVRENTAAARNKKLSRGEQEALEQYAAATDRLYCRGCAQHCEPCVDAPVQIADTLRYRMYHNNYGDREQARELFRALPRQARQIAGVDFSAAEAACPHGLAIGDMMREAEATLT